jgi:hypothetical protein
LAILRAKNLQKSNDFNELKLWHTLCNPTHWRWLSVDNVFELNESEEKELKEAMEILTKYYEGIWLRNLVNLHRA